MPLCFGLTFDANLQSRVGHLKKMKLIDNFGSSFSSRLVNDVFSKDNEGKVPMDKVMILIWLFRDDPSVVQFMAHFVAKVSDGLYTRSL